MIEQLESGVGVEYLLPSLDQFLVCTVVGPECPDNTEGLDG